ncbi:MAG: hypothetical protein HYW23_02430 [Candidatus Aenigmarchaeota archaeon]|nr:hypothetical protein [Candidatus Aenigmarchaeota archaeon]
MDKITCETCSRRFKTAEALEQHKSAAHNRHMKETKPHGKRKLTKTKLILMLVLIGAIGLVGYAIYWSSTSVGPGTIGSTHIHADFAIYVDGKQITPLPRQYFVLSPYMHVEEGPGAGSVLHMHATNVPLKMFFESAGMKLDSKCLELNNYNSLCDDGVNTLKMFVKHSNSTWGSNYEYGDYVFKDLDKILISYGSETQDKIVLEQNNVTDFSKDNSGKMMITR